MSHALLDDAERALAQIEEEALLKRERSILTAQSSVVTALNPQTGQSTEVINLRANNYLSLANDTRLIEAAKTAFDEHGFGARQLSQAL